MFSTTMIQLYIPRGDADIRIQGTGESLRGNLNAAFDKTFGDEEGAAKNSAIAQQGEREISSGQFQQRHRHH